MISKSYTYKDTQIKDIICSPKNSLYHYRVYIGKHEIPTNETNSYWFINDSKVESYAGDNIILASDTVCIELFGYTPENRSSTFSRGTDLPYINGCSTKQLIDPVRPGDPTWQMLYIPPHTSEQAHHIHSTARIVYVLRGEGISHIGMENNTEELILKPGNVLILNKMVPHHFSTLDNELVVLPFHVFSSTDNEYQHPMFNGTFRI